MYVDFKQTADSGLIGLVGLNGLRFHAYGQFPRWRVSFHAAEEFKKGKKGSKLPAYCGNPSNISSCQDKIVLSGIVSKTEPESTRK